MLERIAELILQNLVFFPKQLDFLFIILLLGLHNFGPVFLITDDLLHLLTELAL